MAPAFADRYHVISLDQRGHGESDWPPPSPDGGAYGTQNFVSDLLGLMDGLAWSQMTVCGHSMGGHNAMALAAWHPERVRALAVIDSRPSIPPDRLDLMHRRGHRGPRRHETIESAVKSFRLLPRETVASPALMDHLGRMGIVERDGRFLYRFDPDANGGRLPVDVLPLLSADHGADPPRPRRALHRALPELAREMVSRIARGRLEEIAGSYHHLVLDQPAAFTALLDRFLRDVDATA